MSLLDLADRCDICDLDVINNIFKLWLADSDCYRACGFYNGISGVINALPENWEDWVLYHCTHLSNYGDYCCIIAPPDFEAEYTVYEPFRMIDMGELRVWDEGPIRELYTVKELINWYEKNK